MTNLLRATLVALSLVMMIIAAPRALAGPRVTKALDDGWRFGLNLSAPADAPGVDDSAWRIVNLPHDWSIQGNPDPTNPSEGAGGFFPDGVGWYRKHFSLNTSDSAKRVFADFDSVMANSDVWINGFSLGHRPYGYVPRHDELTGHLNFGDGNDNVLAVRVDQSQQPASRYYTGAGIIGHVRLIMVDPVHFQNRGIFVTTPRISPDQALVHVQAQIVNQSNTDRTVSVRVELVDPENKPLSSGSQSGKQTISAGKSGEITDDISVTTPKLWDMEHPQLYHANVTISDGKDALDDDTVIFGIRSIKFEPATGFSLNGKNIRLQGVCLHADASCFGTAVPLGAWERRLEALRPLGVNALRTAHNPPSPEFLDLCDRMGFVVMDEMFDCWDVAKNPYDYHLYFDQWSLTDLRDAVRRDRNHPSIILYSAGNEIHDTPNAGDSIRILTGLVKAFHENDPTRPVTQALLRPNVSHDYTDGLADLLDVIGTNYRMRELEAAQHAKPSRLIIGTENHISDVPFLATHQNLAGIFIWSGTDYLGEARAWPQFADGSGLLDRTNQPRASAYYVRANWTSAPFVHVARGASREGAIPIYAPGSAGDEPLPGATTTPVDEPQTPPQTPPQPGGRRRHRRPETTGPGPGPTPDWTPVDLKPHPEVVWVYSNCPRVELTLNGKAVPANDAPNIPAGAHTFNVPFAPGVLRAVVLDAAGHPAAVDELRTAGPAAKILLAPDTSKVPNDFDDFSELRAAVTDSAGITVPNTDHEITFTISGPGVIAATDSADNRYHAPFASNKRLTFHGQCTAMVKSNADTGKITITATSPGLTPASVTLEAALPRPQTLH